MRRWFTRWFLTDPAGKVHTADSDTAYHETLQRIRAQFGAECEVEIFARIITDEKSQALQTSATTEAAA